MPHTYVERFAQAYRDEMVDFVNCVLGGHEPRSTGKDGRAAVELGLAAWSSAKRNQPVSLPLSSRDYIPF
jgi:myo-inositol 2-dehydrogenase / D-chiro-inositol 1-dehydrogenase